MKYLIFKLLAASMVAMGVASAQTTPGKVVQGTIFPGITGQVPNYVIAPQPRFSSDLSTANTATSSATLTRDLTVLMDGAATWKCDTSAQFGYCEFKMNIINSPDQSGSCMAKVSVIGDASLYKIQVWDPNAGALVNELPNPMGNYTVATEVPLTALCGQSRSIRVYQSEAGTSPAINFGRMSYGKNDQVINFMQGGQWVGSVRYAATANCQFVRSNAAYGNFSADTDCPTMTVAGGLSYPGSKIPGYIVNSVLPGRYQHICTGAFMTSTTSNWGFRFTDGTTTFGENAGAQQGSAVNVSSLGSINGAISYTAPQSNVTYQIQGKAGTNNHFIDVRDDSFECNVYYFPSAELQAIRADQTNWGWTNFGPITITGTTSNPTKATTTVYDEFWARRNGENLDISMRYYHTSATGAAAGSGDYLFAIPAATGCQIDSSKVRFYTTVITAGSAFPVTSGRGTITASDNSAQMVGQALLYDATRFRMAGAWSAGSGSNGRGAVVSNSFHLTQGVLSYNADFSVPCVGWQPNQGAPQLVGSTYSTYAGSTKVESASISNNGTTATATDGLHWISSVTRNSTGNVTVVPKTPWSSAPNCPTSIDYSVTQTNGRSCYYVKAASTGSSLNFRCDNPGNGYADLNFSFGCFGPR